MEYQVCTLESLQQMPYPTLATFTKRVVGTLGVSRLWLGRCLLALDQGKAAEMGFSGGIHYSTTLGVDRREALEARRVARRLEELPVLRGEAERGVVAWASLREVVRKATGETEERWLELIRELNTNKITKLVSRTRKGAMPGHGGREAQEPTMTELRGLFDAPELRIVQETMRSVSDEYGRPVSFKEAILALCAARSEGTDARALEKAYENAELDLAAMEAPWAAVAAEEEAAPAAEVSLARPARVPHWQNSRLQFNALSRNLTPAQRTEIMRRDCYQCSTPNCPNNLWLQVHHIVFYCRGGATVPDNLALCCSRCHKNLHDGFLQLTGQAPDALHWGTALGSLESIKPAEGFGFLIPEFPEGWSFDFSCL